MKPLSVLLVHAHPDDEASQTGGTIARLVSEGHRVVLVTCTDGRRGEDLHGRTASDPGHDPDGVAATRTLELRASVAALGGCESIPLGHHDSGMPDDPDDIPPNSFSRVGSEPLIGQVLDIMHDVKPDVVITYPPNGLSGHPDHIRAHEITVSAFRDYVDHAERDCDAARLYYIAISMKSIEELHDVAAKASHDGWLPPLAIATDDNEIDLGFDISAFHGQKRDAISAYASQSDARSLTAIYDLPGGMLRSEHYVRVYPCGDGSRADERTEAF